MSRTFRKSLDQRNYKVNKIRTVKSVPDGKCDYHCKCDYCMSLNKTKIIKELHLKEIKESHL